MSAEAIKLARAEWRNALKARIRSRIEAVVHRDDLDAEVERRFQGIISIMVPTDEQLREMQARGELPSDEELERKP